MTFDNQSATTAGSESATATYDAAMPAITVPTRTGYTFGGYYTETNGGGTQYYNADGTSANNWNIAEATTLWAQWTANTYTVKFNGNGGTCGDGEMGDQTFTYDKAQNITANAFTRTGYTFAGWNTQADGNGTSYSDKESVNNLITTNGGTMTLYAQWTANTYTVTFDNQSATTAGSESATATYDAAMPAITVPTRTGYTFGGYYTEENGGGTQYYNADGTSVNNWNIAEATTLYAQWTANTYTVTFEIEGGNGGSESATATYDAAMPAITVPTRTGYTFGGYYTETNGGGTQYYNADGTSAKNWNLTAATTLYAKWVVPYIDANGDTQTCSNFTVLTNSTNISDLSKGWYVVTEDVSYSSQFRCGSGDIHLILCDNAKMTVESNSYAIICGNGSLTIYAQSTGSSMGKLIATASNATGIHVVGSVSICGGNITATGKNSNGFSGIYANGNITIHSGQVSASGDLGIQANGTITLGLRNATDYITASRYKKSVNIVGGQTLIDGTAAYTGNNVSIPSGQTLALPVPITLADGITGITGIVEIGGNKYAKAGATVSVSVAREGYTFSGDITVSPTVDVTDNGNGTYSFTMPEETVTVTYDAKWTLDTYTITYNLNGGTLSTEKNSYTVESDDITLDTPTRKGYLFLGWYTNSDLTGTPVTSIDHGSTGDKQFWAKWAIFYIDANGDTQPCNNFTVLTNTTDISNLSAGWYMVTENVSYSKQFKCSKGDIHLILCDGAKMTIESNSSNPIEVSGYSLTIYAQSTGSSMGQLVATTSDKIGIYASGSITICGGNITATSNSSNGIFTPSGNITIHSGQVNASGGIHGIQVNSGHNITLGLRNATDFIQVSRYQGTVNIAQGQMLTDGTNFYSGNNVKIPDGKTLRPLPTLDLSDNADNAEAIGEAAAASAGGSPYNVILSGRTLYKDGDWNTLCLPFALSAEQIAASPLAGATIMELDGTSSDLTNGTLTLNFNDAKEIEAGRPYIVKWPIGRVISSPSDWKSFAADVAGGNTYEGKTVRLAADIEVSEMAGTYTHPFKGTFDGQGHKLTVTLNNNDDSDKGTDEQYQGVAPFRFTSGATIMNLTVDGTVSTTNRKFAAGFIGWALESTNNIQNCVSSVEICSTLKGDGTHGGFVGKASGTLNITNCLFNGMMTTSQTNGTNSCGGFVGWAATANTGVIIKNSLYAPATIPDGKYKIYDNNSATFARNGANINKSYYTETFGTVQGTYAGGATGSALKNLLGDGWQVKDGKIVPVTTTIDIVNPVFTGVTIDDSNGDVTSKDGNVNFKGTYAPIAWTEETPSILFLGTGNKLNWPLAGARLNAFRAYFELDPNAHAREFVMNFDGGSEETGIISLSKEPRSQGEADAWYTVNGVRLNAKPTTKGMYIRNGKKVVIK